MDSTCQSHTRARSRAQLLTQTHLSSPVEGLSKKTVQNNCKSRSVGIAVEKINVELKEKKFYLIFLLSIFENIHYIVLSYKVTGFFKL